MDTWKIFRQILNGHFQFFFLKTLLENKLTLKIFLLRYQTTHYKLTKSFNNHQLINTTVLSYNLIQAKTLLSENQHYKISENSALIPFLFYTTLHTQKYFVQKKPNIWLNLAIITVSNKIFIPKSICKMPTLKKKHNKVNRMHTLLGIKIICDSIVSFKK